jgi:dihydrolipoamide dehydrogenase
VLKRAFDARVIPLVAYTDPEVAWAGVTEGEAKAKGSKVGKGVFPWAASDRSLSLGRDKGMTKVLFDEQTDRVIGAGIVGPNASDLIAEAVVAIEMGYDATDIGHTITPSDPLGKRQLRRRDVRGNQYRPHASQEKELAHVQDDSIEHRP